MEVAAPFNLTDEELVLDPATVKHGPRSVHESLDWMTDTQTTEDEIERILRGAVVLYARLRGPDDCEPTITFSQCLDTAIIWERG
jgi:hypothetical protein